MRDKTAAAIAICSVETTVSIIGGCWKLTIIQELLDRTLRYGELRRAVGEVTDRVLTRQLRELEEDGLVHREVYAEVPPRVEYSLTPMGQTLRGLVREMDSWGQAWVAEQPVSPPAR
ncbi:MULTISPECIES: winged helix-turn-helix transcriptional regulator [unclassified Plantibacter]|uniref:winged helix-turn-helix transcriptional regulator n=1 Tax=unclassified Plantibacter TaxID=2624265 RepID=UPI003D33F112